jgi:5'-nucleotidase
MNRSILALALLAALPGCATTRMAADAPPVSVKIIALNDFHGNLEPPRIAITAPLPDGSTVKVPAGGVAYLATAVHALRSQNPNHVVVTAGDLIGASPLMSSAFLDEPSIDAMNLIGLDISTVGNHEFDRGRKELLRMDRGGCAKYTARIPCQIDKHFPGAAFFILAANTLTERGKPLFPAYAIRSFGSGRGRVKIGFIGMTLKATDTLVNPGGITGLSFRDEADTANALIPQLRRKGADAIVLLIHQGAQTDVGYNDKSCTGLKGDLLPVLDKLDPAIDLVVSGHTHRSYICDYGKMNPARPFLVTSAERYGTLLTDITLTIDPRTRRVLAKQADNIIVQSEAFSSATGPVTLTGAYPRYAPKPEVAALVQQYAKATEALRLSKVGTLTSPALRAGNAAKESALGDIIADSQLAATKAQGAQIAFMNPYGIRADLVPEVDGTVTYGDIYAIQPFANALVVKRMTGAQIRALLEQQFNSGSNTPAAPNVLQISAGFSYRYDLTKPAGARISEMALDGKALDETATYIVTANAFLSNGGDNFTVFKQAASVAEAGIDLDALQAYLMASGTLAPPVLGRITAVLAP